MSPSEPILSVEGLTVRVGTATLLHDVSFDVARGEMLCVIGESGAGKSTLLKAMQGLMPADCRRFRFAPGGIDVSGAMPDQIGLPRTRWVMQDPLAALNPRQTLGRSIAESLHRHAMTAEQRRAATLDALAEAELSPEFHDLLPGQVSLGQAQRACLARALVAKLELIFFDEPLSTLDALVQKKIAYRMDALRRQSGAAFVFVTHDIGFAEAYADRVLVLKDGRVEASQTRSAFFAAPASAYARALIDAAETLGALRTQEAAE
ncbi:dipeptide/oligopeptide/nickel ABC transporter ATP-binding protein [Pontivivens ytuae]|uniref:ABC transporter ATP-binding protein n=1 Tax=Pontivivens ytuae TaxID=2789856 RepID=A0A7S9LVS5_9RHOB|nr:dipeptide/oligopeptide/nickel ABC transporter ATP-binding protein [Pontivivens ytuae]QPH55620.1 ABC transporter ATP-binding protein [Pontivivens ytuae]